MDSLNFLNELNVKHAAMRFGTPVFIYSQKILEDQAQKALDMPNAFGLTVRYAMKANSNESILRLLDRKGVLIDASSSHEVERALNAGIPRRNILLTTQELPHRLFQDVGWVEVNLTSIEQIRNYKSFSLHTESLDNKVSIRVNPGLGSGGTNRTNVGGPSSSFGIWHEDFDKALNLINDYGFGVKRLHTHIGSGSDPKVWEKVALMSLNYAEKLVKENHPLEILNLGGGYKVGRMDDEESIDLQRSGEFIKKAFEDFYDENGVKLRLEIEPGTFLMANAGVLVSRVIDVVKTSDYTFIKTDTGMTEVTRPSLYGAQHPLFLFPSNSRKDEPNEYVVVGHCCESGDILTPERDNPEKISTRTLRETEIGDLLVIGGVGAYCSSMSAKNYNSFPEAPEVLIDRSENFHLIRKRQTLDQIVQNEIVPKFLS
ncbi:MAG: diaminopimelate decarboxylase [Nanoarchaeota archaeon]